MSDLVNKMVSSEHSTFKK